MKRLVILTAFALVIGTGAVIATPCGAATAPFRTPS